MVETRHAGASELAPLSALVAEYWRFENIFGFDSERIANALTRLFSNPELGGGWIATVDGKAAGYLLAVYVFSLEHLGRTAEIDEFFVVPAARGQGAGTALLRAAEAEFVRVGCTNISLREFPWARAERPFRTRNSTPWGYAPRWR